MTMTRTAVVTGGARGMGEAIAGRLASDGCNVAIWDLDIDAARATAARLTGERRVLAIACDQSDPASVAHATDATKAHFDSLDILVNNAGITGPNATTVDYPVEEWIRVIEVDLIGVYLCCKWVVPHLVEAGWGRVLNIASVAGKEGNPNASAYSAAKGGVIALTKSLAKELIGTGVIVNCITPAAVRIPPLRSDVRRAHPLHAGKDPHGPLWTGRGNRGDGVVAVFQRVQLLHGRGFRYLGRPGDLLIR